MKTIIILALLVSCGKESSSKSLGVTNKSILANSVTPTGIVYPSCGSATQCFVDKCINGQEYMDLKNKCDKVAINSSEYTQCQRDLTQALVLCRQNACSELCSEAGVFEDKLNECVNACWLGDPGGT